MRDLHPSQVETLIEQLAEHLLVEEEANQQFYINLFCTFWEKNKYLFYTPLNNNT